MARQIQVAIVGDASSYVRALNRAQGATSGFGSTLTRLAIGGIAAGIGGLTTLGTLSAKAAIDFESSFAGIRKTVDATEPQFEALQKGIRNMAKEIPAGVNQLNEIGEMAGQLGIKRKGMLQFIRTIADLGETTNLVGEEAASTMAKLSNVMQLPQSQIRRLGSTIVALGNAGASTERDIADFGLRIAGAGKIAGLSAPQVLAIGNAFTSVGVEAEAGGTAVSKVLLNMNTAVLSGGKQLEGFAKIAGVTAAEFKQSFQKDAGEAFTSFVEGLDRITKGGGNAAKALADLGLTDQRLLRAFLGAAGAGDILRESIELGTKAWKDNTALTKEAEKRYETTASQLKILRNRWVDLKITIGEQLLPILNRAIEGFVRFAEKLGAATTVRAKLNIIWDAVTSNVGDLWVRIKDEINLFFKGETRRVQVREGVEIEVTEPVVKINWSGLRAQIDAGVAELFAPDTGADEKIEAKAKEWFEKFDNALRGAAKTERGKWADDFGPQVLEPLERLAGRVELPGMNIGRNLVRGIRGGTAALGPLMSQTGTSIVQTFTQRIPAAFGAAVQLGSRVVSGIRSGLGPLLGAVREKLSGIFSAITGAAGRAFSAAVGIGRSIVSGVVSGLGALYGAVKSKIEGVIGSVLGSINIPGMSPPEHAAAEAIGKPLARGVVLGWVTGTRDLPSKMADTLRNAIERAQRVVEGARDKFSRAFDDLASRILRAFDAQTSGHETATEQLLREQDERRRMEDLIQRQAEAQAKLNKLITEGAEASEIAAAVRDVERATEDVARPALEAQAAEERKQFESQREELRLHLEKRLEALEAHWAKVGVKSQKALNQLNALLLKVGLTDFNAAGKEIGDAFVAALLKSIKDAVKAGGSIAQVISSVTAGIAAPPVAPERQLAMAPAGTTNITVNAPNYVGDKQDLADTVRSELVKISNRQGTSWLS